MTNGQECEPESEVTKLARIFEKLYAQNSAELEKKALGSHVVFNVKTGQYVIGKTMREALKSAEQTFGSTKFCWSRRIGALW